MRAIGAVVLLLLTAAIATAAEPDQPKRQEKGWPDVADTAVKVLLGAAIGPVCLYLYKWWNKPVLKPSVVPDAGSLIVTPVMDAKDMESFRERHNTDPNCERTYSSKAKYARLRVMNTGRKDHAVRCRGTLVAMEKTVRGGVRTPLPFTDTGELIWAGGGPVGALEKDIPRGVPAFLNLCTLNLARNKIELCLAATPFMYHSLFDEDGTYYFHVLLTCENADPVSNIVVRVTWNRTAQTLEIALDEKQKPA